MVRLILKTLGGRPKLVSVLDVISGRDPPLAGYMLHLGDVRCTELTCGGPPCEELSGGNWMG
jgi:hypothetical protein